MADFDIDLAGESHDRLRAAFDVEGKIPRAIVALGPVGDRDVAVVGGGALRVGQLRDLGARVRDVPTTDGAAGLGKLEAGSIDVVVSFWSAFRGVDRAEIAAAERALRPGGRLLVVHDYGRDDVSRLRGDQPEYGSWGRRDGPFLRGGFRIRVIHAFWTFDSLDLAAVFLGDVFGPDGMALAAGLKRPRLSYNVAIYHRSVESGDNVR